eukprot:gene14963-15101_t
MNLDLLYSVEREFDSSIDDLWDAWVNPQKLEIWYHPTDLSNVLVLLPPSEGKIDGTRHDSRWLEQLSFNTELSERRRALGARLGLPPDSVPVSPAIDILQGVLYKSLDYRSLPLQAQKKANSHLLIFSGLFGAIRPLDEIPNHKYKMKSSDWSDLLPPVLDGIESKLIVDCRSSTYSAVWKPDPQITVYVRVFQESFETRSIITHMSKKYRGELTRKLLEGSHPQTPQELHQKAGASFDTHLHQPVRGKPWLLDLIIPK